MGNAERTGKQRTKWGCSFNRCKNVQNHPNKCLTNFGHRRRPPKQKGTKKLKKKNTKKNKTNTTKKKKRVRKKKQSKSRQQKVKHS